jgi:hypothetical protein
MALGCGSPHGPIRTVETLVPAPVAMVRNPSSPTALGRFLWAPRPGGHSSGVGRVTLGAASCEMPTNAPQAGTGAVRAERQIGEFAECWCWPKELFDRRGDRNETALLE